jgi:hypothetical protein
MLPLFGKPMLAGGGPKDIVMARVLNSIWAVGCAAIGFRIKAFLIWCASSAEVRVGTRGAQVLARRMEASTCSHATGKYLRVMRTK